MELQILFNILINVFFTLIACKTFFNLFLEENKKNNSSKISIFVIVVWQISLVIYQFDVYTVILMSMLTVGLFAFQMYQGKILVKIAFISLYIVVSVLIEFIVGCLFILFNISIYDTQLLGLVVSKTITIVLIFIFWYLKRISNITKYTAKYSWIITVTPIMSLVLMSTIFRNILVETNQVDLRLYLLLGVVLLFTNMVVWKVYQLLMKEFEDKQAHLRFLDQVQLQKEHSDEVELMLNNIRRIKHNIKHQYTTISGYLDNNELERAKEFLKESFDEEWNQGNICNTGNIAIDTIVNSKYLKMEKNNIRFKIVVDVPSSIPVLGIDLSILIGNILENSIEANLKVEKIEDRYIDLYITYANNYLILSCVNIFNGRIIKNTNGMLESVKEDIDQHGFGITSIRNVCSKYNGSTNIETTDNKFIIKCILFISI